MLRAGKSIKSHSHSIFYWVLILGLLNFLLITENVSLAQQKYFRQYTTNDGLASNQLQSVFQDAD